jgi:tagatose-6-phosphate ketose/aldose isomerase
MTLLGYKESMLKDFGAENTAKEIDSQPEIWKKIYQQIVREKDRIRSFLSSNLPEVDKIILTGAGTSAHIGLSLRGTYYKALHTHTDAVAATDLVTHPQDYFFDDETIILVSFARSGNSPESAAAVNLADKLCKKCHHLIITCNPSGQLAIIETKFSKLVLILPPESNDKSLAMTISYSGMLLCGLLITRINLEDIEPQIDLLCRYGRKIIDKYASDLMKIANLEFSRTIFLGSGPFYGTATESQLKLQELTDGNIICKCDSYLGFRHGPKAVTDEQTLMVFIFSNKPYVLQYEKDLVRSMKKGKKALYTIAVLETQISDLQFDLEIVLSESGDKLSEELLTVCNIIPSQLIGFYKSISLGLKPDSPSVSGAISRVVENVKIYSY